MGSEMMGPETFGDPVVLWRKAVKPERLRLATAGLLLFWIVWWYKANHRKVPNADVVEQI